MVAVVVVNHFLLILLMKFFIMNKNTFCGMQYLSHCFSLHGTVVAVTCPWPCNVSETFLRGHVATIPGTCLSNLKFVPFAVLELLAFNAQKIYGGYVTLATPTSDTFVRGHVGTIPGNMPAKFEVVSSAVLILQHLTPKNLRGHVTQATPTSETCKGSCRDYPWEHACQI